MLCVCLFLCIYPLKVQPRMKGNVLFKDTLNTFYLQLFGRKEGNVLFNDALNTFYLQLYGVRHMVKEHSDSVRRNLLPPLHGILVSISTKGSFISIISQTEQYIPRLLLYHRRNLTVNKMCVVSR